MLNALKKLFGGGGPDPRDLVEQGALLIDVRTAQEYASGHAKGSQNIPLNKIGSHVEKLRKKGKPIVTCCASGMRSGSASRKLKSAGLEAYNGGPWTRFS